MATFKTIVRYKRADGFYQVYIRVVHRTKSGYIKTDKFVTDKQITKSGEIKGPVVNEYCWVSRKLVGICIQLSNAEKEELFISNPS